MKAVKRQRIGIAFFVADLSMGQGKFCGIGVVHIKPAVEKARNPAISGIANQKNLFVVVREGIGSGMTRPSVHLGAAVENFNQT